jgi:hypothetical protein
VTQYVLEPVAAKFAYGARASAPLYALTPSAALTRFEDIEAGPVAKTDVDSMCATVDADGTQARVRIVKRVGATGQLPVRELSVGVHAAVVFVDYDHAPEARPAAIEQPYAAARWIHRRGADADRRDDPGEAARGDIAFVFQSLYYPVTDRAGNSPSYRDFTDGPSHLIAKAMAWFWDAYLPDTARCGETLASPLRGSIDELAGLPETFVIGNEYDALRDEGEAYAHKADSRRRALYVHAIQRRHSWLHDAEHVAPVRSGNGSDHPSRRRAAGPEIVAMPSEPDNSGGK